MLLKLLHFSLLSLFLTPLVWAGYSSVNDESSSDAQTKDLPLYQKVRDLPQGALVFGGSESLMPLLLEWAREFALMYPQVSVTVTGGGSAAAVQRLMENTPNFIAPMSREMTSKERDAFRKNHGYLPLAIQVAMDAVAVYVNESNPISAISIENLSSIYSEEVSPNATVWGQVGVQGSWAEKSITAFGRPSTSGTYDLFDSVVLRVGGYQPAVKVMTNPWDILDAIEDSPSSIGFAGIGVNRHPGVKVLPLLSEKGVVIGPTRSNCLSKDYPMSRILYLYILKSTSDAKSTLNKNPVQAEFFRYILSQQGQNVVVRQGMFALQAPIAGKMLRAVEGMGLFLE